MIEDFTELVVFYPPDVRGVATQVGETSNRICDRTARHFRRRAHHGVDFVGTLLVNQVHRARHDAHFFDQCIIDMCQNIDNRVADAK